MKSEQQQIAIATACGFTIKSIEYGPKGEITRVWADTPDSWRGKDVRPWLPDFLNDFNAIREAIASLKDKKARWPTHSTDEPALHVFSWHLIDLLGLDEYEPDVIKLVLADAEKLCEAFLKTLNLWVE